MADRRRRTTTYRTYGNVAYAPEFDGSAVRAPRREEEQQAVPKPRPKGRVHHKALVRPQVQVREAGQVAPFAVIGFVAVALFAMMLLTSYASLVAANGEVVSLRRELSNLEKENTVLTAQYEKVFDMETILAAVGETMVRPSSDQVVYIDLSEPDTVLVYGEETAEGAFGLFRSLGEAVSMILEYF